MLENKMISASFSYNIIYIFTVPDITSYSGFCKIGKTSLPALNENWTQISQEEIDRQAEKRIKEILSTAGLPFRLEFAKIAIRKDEALEKQFTDFDFHNVLRKNNIHNETPNNFQNYDEIEKIIKATGREWFKISAQDAISYLLQFMEGKINFETDRYEKIVLRKHQELASAAITKAWNKIKFNIPSTENKISNKFLLNAIMRFGKCITTYDFVLKNDIQRVLILTHRPVVSKSWKEDYDVFFNNKNDPDRKNKNYHYLTKDITNGKSYDKYKNEKLIYFASIQDLRGIENERDAKGNFIYDDEGDKLLKLDENANFNFKLSNKEIFEDDWDLVVIDEAHEGNLTQLAKKMHENIKRKFSLYLSGTPYNIMNEEDFEKEFGDNIFIFDQNQELLVKKDWSKEFGTDHNPYDDLPDLNILGISISNTSKDLVTSESGFVNNYFDFSLFFQLDENNEFLNRDSILAWLDNISSECKTELSKNMPFHISNRFQTKHSLWYLPADVKKANALQCILQSHPIFKHYKIFNVCGDNYNSGSFDEIINCTNDEHKCSITITIGRLTQGVTVPGWTAILLLNDIASPMKYFQAIYRIKSPSPKNWTTRKTTAQVYDFAPDRMLDLLDRVIESKVKNEKPDDYEMVSREVLNYYNVLILKDNELITVDDSTIKEAINRIKVNRVVNKGFNSIHLLDKTKIGKFISNLDATKIREKIEEFNNLQSKTSKNHANTNGKITDNDFDKKIVSAIETDEKTLTAEEADQAVTQEKNKKALIRKITDFLLTVATRLPFMLIGRYRQLMQEHNGSLKNLSIETFCDLFDDEDWKEIMQNLEKKEFKQNFNDFIDKEVFIAACELCINKIKKIICASNPLERRDMWIELFKNIHNPDNETVLTPWNVVKIQYEVMSLNWNDLYLKNKTFVDINSKSSFYPLFAACQLYEQQLAHGLKDWRNIIHHRIFAICRTSLTRDVAKVILNYNDKDKNIQIYDIIKHHFAELSKKEIKWEEIIEEIMKKFSEPKLKFDYCVANPPYQLPINSDKTTNNKASANNIYDKFVLIGKKIADQSCMIFPAKWMTGGKGLQKFREEILSSQHINHLIDCEDYWNLFPTISLHCGLTILYMDRNIHQSTKISYLKNFEITNTVERRLDEYDVLVIDQKKYEILKTIEKKLNIKSFSDWEKLVTMDKKVSARKPFGLSSNFYSSKDIKISLSDNRDAKHDVKIYYIAINKEHKNKHSIGNRLFSYMNRNDIKINLEGIGNFKVCIPIAGGGDRAEKSILSKTIICEPDSICSESYRVCGTFATEKEAVLFSYFMESKILRFLVSIRKLTQHAPRDVYKFVPYIDVINQLTKWQSENTTKLRRQALDEEIMNYLGLNDKQQVYILNSINEISNDLDTDLDDAEEFNDEDDKN